jgi:hypothetical protein
MDGKTLREQATSDNSLFSRQNQWNRREFFEVTVFDF